MEEMLIVHALPIMQVYINPGGQIDYSGHCINNLPQHVEELACFLPRLPKDLSVVLVRTKGKGNSFNDLSIRKKNVIASLHWLIKFISQSLFNNNPHYKNVHINQQSLNCCLP